MSQFSSFNMFFLKLVIILLSVECILCAIKPNFCKDNDTVIDAVLWDGMRYRLTRNEWIAEYDEKTGSVGEYYKSDLENIQSCLSSYNITEVPECHDMSNKWCLHMTRLKGLVVYLYRNTPNEALYKIVKQNQSLDLPYGLQSTGSLSDKSVFWPKFLNNSKILPNIPALYIPNKFTFIYFYSFHIQSVIINRLLQTEGLVEQNWKEISRRGPYPHGREHLLTAFWWKPNNEVYIIAEENKTLRVYKLGDDMNQTFEFILINQTVKEFFGCSSRSTTGTATKTSDSLGTKTSPTDESSESSSALIYVMLVLIVIGVIIIVTIGLIYFYFTNKSKKFSLISDKSKARKSEKLTQNSE